MIIEKKYHFYAAHRNKGGGVKCGRIHGHTYKITCQFKFNQLNEYGVTILFSDIDKLVEPIIKYYDHNFLLYKNDQLVDCLNVMNEPFIELPFETSAENLCLYLFTRIKNETQLPIIKIELAETETSKVIYEPKSI
jgi:6-pyruvoyltetrahydropterin/6-carboxytetrahydropterin synthase